MTSGIYLIRNIVNGKLYVGQSFNIEHRLKGHFRELRKGCHSNKHLQRAFRKYGEDAFEIFIAKECRVEELTKWEQHFIDMFPERYNQRPTADSMLGYKFTSKAKIKMSVAKKGKSLSEEHKRNLSIARVGRKPMLGHHHSKEAKAKISAASKNLSAETRAKMSAAGKGRKCSVETRAKRSAALMGHVGFKYWLNRKLSKEHIAKMIQGKRAAIARRKEEETNA